MLQEGRRHQRRGTDVPPTTKEASEVDDADSRCALHVDLASLKSYGTDVYAATDAYLATVSDGDLG
jgi:hypothetical protein